MDIHEALYKKHLELSGLKKRGLIQDYSIKLDTSNYELTPDGEITFDMNISVSVVPCTPAKFITVDIKL